MFGRSSPRSGASTRGAENAATKSVAPLAGVASSASSTSGPTAGRSGTTKSCHPSASVAAGTCRENSSRSGSPPERALTRSRTSVMAPPSWPSPKRSFASEATGPRRAMRPEEGTISTSRVVSARVAFQGVPARTSRRAPSARSRPRQISRTVTISPATVVGSSSIDTIGSRAGSSSTTKRSLSGPEPELCPAVATVASPAALRATTRRSPRRSPATSTATARTSAGTRSRPIRSRGGTSPPRTTSPSPSPATREPAISSTPRLGSPATSSMRSSQTISRAPIEGSEWSGAAARNLHDRRSPARCASQPRAATTSATAATPRLRPFTAGTPGRATRLRPPR